MAAKNKLRWIKAALEESVHEIPVLPWQRAAKRSRRNQSSVHQMAAQC